VDAYPYGRRPVDDDTYRLRMVNADALVWAYAMLGILQLIADGVPRREAARRCWLHYCQVLAPAQANISAKDVQDMAVIGEHSTYCVALSADELAARLVPRPDPFWVPFTYAQNHDVATVLWLLEATRRAVFGTPLLEAARGAYDAHLGLVRRRRRPVEHAWLVKQLSTALDRIWALLLAARWQRGPLFPGLTEPPGWADR
jgi:predicted NAD/FAD-binding protein